eukprot:193802_1
MKTTQHIGHHPLNLHITSLDDIVCNTSTCQTILSGAHFSMVESDWEFKLIGFNWICVYGLKEGMNGLKEGMNCLVQTGKVYAVGMRGHKLNEVCRGRAVQTNGSHGVFK